jgi:glycosyltransferase involved in cell wall biosynthesis
MKLSFLVTVHNEGKNDFGILMEQLAEYLKTNSEDEVIILDDHSDNQETIDIINQYKCDNIKHVQHKLDLNFGAHKQFGNEQCSGNWIFQIDSDEYFSEGLLFGLKDLVSSNPNVELYLVPRINILRGLTQEAATKFGWEVSEIDGLGDENGNYKIINWRGGDYQYRFYKNDPKIRWERPLHELIVGAKTMTQIPREPNWALIHDKNLEKQLSQNAFYNQNFSREMNVRKG